MLRWPLFFLLCVAGKSTLAAQSPSYTHYGVREGLPGNVVYCAVQDYRGFMWFGTDKGLARFDGSHFQVFGMNDGLPDPEVLGLFEDSHHRLWISCFSQKPCYLLNGRFVTANNDSLLARIHLKNSLSEFSEDDAGNIWIAHRGNSVFVFDGQSVEEKPLPITTIRMEQSGSQFFAVGFPQTMEMNSNVHYIYPLSAKDRSMAFVSMGASGKQFLAALSHKLFLFEWKNGQFVETDSALQTGGNITSDRKGRFWICPKSKGAVCFANDRHNLSNPIIYLPEQKVNAVFEDRHGTFWFCTYGDGVYALAPGKAATFSRADGLITEKITALAWDQQGYLLAGDDEGSLYEFKGYHIRRIPLTPPGTFNRSRQIISLPDLSRWIATDLGLFRQTGSVARQMGTVTALKCILVEPGRLWVGNHVQLGYFPDRQQQLITISPSRTTTLGDDTEGNVWAGKMEGLYSLRDSFHYNWGERFPALKNHIAAIHNAGPGRIWVVTPESGLLLASVSNGTVTGLDTINRHLRQPIDNIQSLCIEPGLDGKVWLATNSGVYGLDPDDWRVVHYTHRDGLADDDVACVLVARDTLWAGTVAGLSYLPLREQGSNKDFGTFITDLHYQVGTQQLVAQLLDSLPSRHRIVLPPDAAMLTLYLAGLDYRSQGKMEYACVRTTVLPPLHWWTRQNLFKWIANGFEGVRDSNVIGENNLNFGIALPPGGYQIRVTAVNAKGLYSRQPDQWTIIMRPYWYNTLWFDLLLWALLGYGAWRMVRIGTGYRKLNVEVSDLQLRALQSQINPHFVGNSINAIQQFFYPPNPVAASHYVELFTRLLRRTIFLSEKHFNAFDEELAYDRDYLDMIKLRFGERFQYKIAGADAIPDHLPFPSMLLQPILENATIHGLAPEGVSRLVLQFSLAGKKLQCTLTDNGLGYKALKTRPAKHKEHKSKGIELLHKKVAAFNQLYDLGLRMEWQDLSEVSPPGQGTRVTIVFYPEKIGNKHERDQNPAD